MMYLKLLDSTSKLCLKDVREHLTRELTSRLKSDPVALEKFYRAFGLDPVKLRTQELLDIKEFFPDTPVKTLRDVFEALRLYDLVDLLDKVTIPQALRPALSLKEIEKLPEAYKRPTKIYTKTEVLIVSCSDCDGADDSAQNFGSFFKALNSQSQITTLSTKALLELCKDLKELRNDEEDKVHDISRAKRMETRLKNSLETKIPVEYDGRAGFYPKTREQILGMSKFYKDESIIENDLRRLVTETEQLTKERIQISEEIMEKEKKLKEENQKFERNVSSHVNKWIEQTHDKGWLTLILEMAPVAIQ